MLEDVIQCPGCLARVEVMSGQERVFCAHCGSKAYERSKTELQANFNMYQKQAEDALAALGMSPEEIKKTLASGNVMGTAGFDMNKFFADIDAETKAILAELDNIKCDSCGLPFEKCTCEEGDEDDLCEDCGKSLWECECDEICEDCNLSIDDCTCEEICDDCGKPIDDCICSGICKGCGEPNDACECDDEVCEDCNRHVDDCICDDDCGNCGLPLLKCTCVKKRKGLRGLFGRKT